MTGLRTTTTWRLSTRWVQTLARRRFPEGLEGITRLHALIGEYLPDPSGAGEPPVEVVVGIETERGPWAAALVAAGYRVHAINPLSPAMYRERNSTSGAKSDAGDAHILAEIVRLDRTHHRQVAGDTALAEAVKLAARTHQSLVWDRTRQILRLRSALRESFPAALRAFDELDAPDTLHLLRLAPDPDAAARLTKRQVMAALTKAHRRNPEMVADQILAVLRASELRQAPPVQAAFAAIVAAQVALISTLNEQVDVLGEVVAGGHDNAVRLWNAQGRALRQPLLGHSVVVSDVSFNPDGTMLASASLDGTVRLWDPATGQPVGAPLIH